MAIPPPGTPFPPDSPGEPPDIHQVTQNLMDFGPSSLDASCPNCGAPDVRGQGNDTCPNCGAPLPNPQDSSQKPDIIDRNKPEPDEQRKQLVQKRISEVKAAKRYWEKNFKQMLKDQKFCSGQQWPEETKSAAFNDSFDDRYVANITLRHVKQRVAACYAKNPKVVARLRPLLLSTIWDGTAQELAQAQQTMQQLQVANDAQQKLQTGIQLGLAAAQSGQPLTTLAGKPEFAWQDPSAGVPPGAPGAPTPGADLMTMLGRMGASMQANGQSPMFPPPQPPPDDEVVTAQAVIADAQAVKKQVQQLKRIGRTLEILFEYEISQQQQSFKSRMKMVVRRAATAGVGWVRVGFQRVMAPDPDKDSKLTDVQTQLEIIEEISADIADGETSTDSPEVEQLRLVSQSLGQQTDIVVREGLIFSWPKSTAIIPDKSCIALRDFLGCNWVAEEFCLTPEEIERTYKVDIESNFTGYTRTDNGLDTENYASPRDPRDTTGQDTSNNYALVWEIFNKEDGLVYTVCDGYNDFLREPAAPEFYTDRFWPWFLVAFNETEGEVWPKSDVALIRPMQLEMNRSRQGLREHRFANRPKTAYADGVLSQEDIDALKNPPNNAMIAVSGLQLGQSIDQVIQGIKGVPIDPNIYTTQEIFQDMLRVAGDQQADLGPTSGATATESNIAAQARATATGSEIDDIDDTLSSMAQSAGQILLLNVSPDTVKKIVGPGAIWPQLTKGEVAQQLYLDIEAGSSGKPNQAQELQNFERLAPIIMQIPGISPMFLAREAITRLDDSINVDDAIAEGIPSIIAQNGIQPGASLGPPGAQPPGAQGPRGASNSPGPPSPQSSAPTPMNSGPPKPPGPPGLPN